ncbi:anti-phage protein Ppl [Photobacterium carnosum]|uniref:Uncharacterized protein n=1 Tax=Photobacterium carnosum TaxID=2023717 RepID=A0A2N4USS0_9GAMM|nr:anti-phage protein Ppl [Photobacterium carnosum]PLC58047.1 hypothetical protein CIK00_10285 [Photobacterium carnosum]
MPVGSKWFRFDFHNHTTASNDYKELELTHRQWLLSYMSKDIDAVVISDHNSGSNIDVLKSELELMKQEASTVGLEGYRPLTIFPGVELTATGNVHILAIFDENSSGSDIERLIGVCNSGAATDRTKGNHELVLQCSAAQIVKFIQSSNAISILAHIDATKGALSITNEGELNALFNSNPNAIEIRYDLAGITNGTHRKLIEHLPKVRGSDAHHPDHSGQRSCWLKMSMLNFDGLKTAILDHDNCVLLDDIPPIEPNLQLTKLILNTKHCHTIDGQAVEIEFNPFYNAVIGSRGSGKSTLVESIRLGMRKYTKLAHAQKVTFDKFKSIGKGMEANSEIICFYKKDGHHYKLCWRPENITALYLQTGDGEWIEDKNWSDDRFNLQIFSQKMLFELASNPRAFLDICDESPIVNKRQWTEKSEQLVRDFKAARINLRTYKAKEKILSVLQGELTDHERAISGLNNSKYYTEKTKITALEEEKRKIETLFSTELSIFDIISELVKSDPVDVDDRKSNSQECQHLKSQAIDIKKEFKLKVNSALAEAREQFAKLQGGCLMTNMAANIKIASENAEKSAALLKEQGLNPDGLDQLLLERTDIQHRIESFRELTTLIAETKENIKCIYLEMINHRKLLSASRKAFIDTLKLNGLTIKILPLSSLETKIVDSYQLATGISTFKDKIYDQENRTGILSEFILLNTIAPHSKVIDKKYELLNNAKIVHEKIVKGISIDQVIHGSYKRRISELTVDDFDNLLCWFPEDGIDIRYKALSGRMEDIESASPGQKAASMLQFLLSYGTDPLLIDQPEDDLDCLMLSDSVIPAITLNKKRRQLIIVSHSAPIVVNGDAEYVISMIHDKDGLRPHICGALQEQQVKSHICNQMEGGERAFRSRFSRILN